MPCFPYDACHTKVHCNFQSLTRLLIGFLKCVLIAAFIVFPVIVISAKSTCQEDLDLYQYNPVNGTMNAADQDEWCKHFSGSDTFRHGRIGHPCVCPPREGHRCNPALDPAAWVESRDSWCAAFGTVDESLHLDYKALTTDNTFHPCECLSALQQHMPDWTLALDLMVILLTIMFPVRFFMWVFYTYIWCAVA